MPKREIVKEGTVFYDVTYIREIESKSYTRKAEFRCICGNTFISILCKVKNGTTRSCGCLWRKYINSIKKPKGEGWKPTVEMSCWQAMRQRCYNSNCKEYKYYGGRGITVCDRWKDSFENFLEDMGKRPGKGYSIERRDVDSNYEPHNCYWTTWTVQARNKRRSIIIEYKGEKKHVKEWSQDLGISYSMIMERLKRGWSVEDTLTLPKNHYKNRWRRSNP